MKPSREAAIAPPSDPGTAPALDPALGLDPAKLPRHVAVIMDGNGRWARGKGWTDRARGHEMGAEAVRSVTRGCARLGIGYLTLFAFSSENWSRPKREIAALMALLKRYLVQEIGEMNDNNIRLFASGNIGDLPADVRRQLDATREATSKNTGMALNLALSYGGRDEIVHAARHLAEEAAAGRLDPASITPELFRRSLYLPEFPDPDLLIRSSGEMRISNFLLWQLAYTEIHVTPTLWPDFRDEHLREALLDYARRERRFGRVAS